MGKANFSLSKKVNNRIDDSTYSSAYLYVVAILLIHSINPDEFPIVLQKDPEGEEHVSMSSEVADNDCFVCTRPVHQ